MGRVHVSPYRPVYIVSSSKTMIYAQHMRGRYGRNEKLTIHVHIEKGWNFFSVPIVPDLNKFMDYSLLGPGWRWDNSLSSGVYVASQTIQPLVGYMVYSLEARSISISGLPVTDGRDGIFFNAGWNILPVLPNFSIPDNTKVANIFGMSSGQYFDVRSVDVPLWQDFEKLQVGKAYWGYFDTPRMLDVGSWVWDSYFESLETPR